VEHPCFPSSFSTQTCPTCFRNFFICLLASTLSAPIISPHSPTMDGLPFALLILQWPLTVLRRRMSPHPSLRCSWSLHLLSAPWAFPIIPPLVTEGSGSASQTYKCRVWDRKAPARVLFLCMCVCVCVCLCLCLCLIGIVQHYPSHCATCLILLNTILWSSHTVNTYGAIPAL